MMDFGAKLTLKDNMYATLQKNLKAQRDFSAQVDKTSNSLKGLGNTKANPTISARDNASGIIENIRDSVEQVDSMVATPDIEIRDEAEEKADAILESIRSIGRMAVSPVIKLKDMLSSSVSKIKQKLKDIATTYTPIMKVRDLASQGISKVKNYLGGIQKKWQATLQAKDVASKVITKIKNNLKTVGKTVAKPFVKLKDGATKLLSSIKAGLKSVGSMVAKPAVALKDGATAGLGKIGNMLKTLAKGVTIAVSVAGAGLTALMGGSIKEGASLEQSIGGVETLFKGDAGIVTANADKAFRTAGLSANEYMETVTSFSASLLASLGGDTTKSAQIADQAIIDMADNANKFGTDMESIQNAYQGFAKQNYTMLDNLKLGYGGTKEEMDRLLKDAQKISGVKYDISNLSDIYSAIHVIQEDLGVAGTTAKEASSTFSGSFASMKASAKNLLGNLALGGDITGSMEALMDSASTFLFDNALPMVGRIFEALPDAIGVAIEKGLPKIKQLGGKIVKSLKEGLKKILPAEMGSLVDPAFEGMGSAIKGAIDFIKKPLSGLMFGGFDGLASSVQKCIPVVQTILSTLGGALEKVTPIVIAIREAFWEVFPDILGAVTSVIPVINPIIEGMGGVMQAVIPVAKDVISMFAQTVQQVMPIVSQIFGSVSAVVVPIVQNIASLIQTALPIVQGVIETVTGAIASVMPTISSIFEGVGSKIAEVVAIIQDHMGLFQSIFETVSPIVQGAIEIVASVFSTAWDIISPIIDLALTVFDALLTCVEAVFPTVQSIVQSVWSVLEGIFGAIADGLSLVGDAISGVASFIGDGISTIGSWFGFAYGKDRVPYDGYPAVLHEGEKVLTRNQADQYDRAMSTRGVQLNAPVSAPVSDTDSSSAGDSVSVIQSPASSGETKIEVKVSFDGANINNLGDMEQVADQVTEAMVKKMRKIIPNMA